MLRIIPLAPLDAFPTHFKKHRGRIDSLRADRLAEAAETALEGQPLTVTVRRVVRLGDRFRITAALEITAFGDAALTARASVDNRCTLLHESRAQGPVRV
jgi:hypothetical protein